MTFFFLDSKGKKKKGGGNEEYVSQSNGEEGWIFTFIIIYSESDCVFVLVMNKPRYCPFGLYWLNSVAVMGGVFLNESQIVPKVGNTDNLGQ